jgi:hypothetical protein
VILTIVAALVVVLRLSAVSAFDPGTTYVMMREIGSGNVLIGTLTSLLDIVLLLLVLAILAMLLVESGPKFVLIPVLGIVAVIAAFVIPAGQLLIAILGYPIGSWVGRRRGRKRAAQLVPKDARGEERDRKSRAAIAQVEAEIEKQKQHLGWLISIYLSFITVSALLFEGPWLPLEVVTIDDEQRVGYILRAEDDQVVFLTRGSRTVEYLDGSIQERAICRAADIGPLPNLLESPLLPKPTPDYEACPDHDSDPRWRW